MTFTGSWVLNTLKENQDMRMIAVPVPEGAQGQEGAIISVFGSGWYMSKTAAERSDAALNFVKYMCSPEILARFIEVPVAEKIRSGEKITNSELRKALAAFSGGNQDQEG